MPRAIGRSKRLESLGSSAGARFTVMRRAGNSKCAWLSAARTRSRASRTSASGSPTIWKAGRPGPRCTSTVTSGACTPESARLATVATDIGSPSPQGEQRRRAPGVYRGSLPVRAALEVGNPCFERGELRLGLLEELPLYFEILAHHEVHAAEPVRKQRPQVLLEIRCRGVAQRLVYALTQVVEEMSITHVTKVSLAMRTAPVHPRAARAP